MAKSVRIYSTIHKNQCQNPQKSEEKSTRINPRILKNQCQNLLGIFFKELIRNSRSLNFFNIPIPHRNSSKIHIKFNESIAQIIHSQTGTKKISPRHSSQTFPDDGDVTTALSLSSSRWWNLQMCRSET
jgi:hypothetical protein